MNLRFTIAKNKVTLLMIVLGMLLSSQILFAQDIYTDVGAGSYRNTLAGSDFEGDQPPEVLYKTDNVTGALPSNEWWSSALWREFSTAMYPHPLAAKAYAEGLGVRYPEISVRPNTHPFTSKDIIDALYEDSEKDFVLGGAGFVSQSALVSGYSDWQVFLQFANTEGTSSMTTTLTMGSPYIYVTYDNVTPTVSFSSVPVVWSGDANSSVLGISVNGNNYALFAPTGSTWQGLGTDVLTCVSPSGADYLSIAVLPEGTETALAEYETYAYAFVTDTKVSWAYDAAASSVNTVYNVTTEVKEAGKSSETISVLYPHQWNNSSDTLLPYTYRSPRGTMKTLIGNGFSTTMTYRGILPNLPDLGADKARLAALIDEYEAEDSYIIPGPDGAIYGTYWMGKNLNRLSQIIPLAEQVGDQDAQDKFTQALRVTFDRWLNPKARPDEGYNFFYYNPTWGTLTGYDSGFGAAADLNDHHFHYGYWIYAAALLARYDAEWASSEQYGQMVELIAKEIANPDRADTMFPFLRNFDTYAGHSWADGNGDGYMIDDVLIDSGNNQESSSEAINAWAALILWGEETGNTALRDLGIYMYTTEVEAINSYWFDIKNENLPAEYTYDYLPMVFSGHGEYRVWWTSNVEEIHGINFLPITGASFYLGVDPTYCESNYNMMVAENTDANNETGIERAWADIYWQYQALYDPQGALAKFDANEKDYGPEFGKTKANTYHWISNFIEFGKVNTTVTADTATYAVFDNGTVRTYVAYNAGAEAKTVTFSDGVSMTVLSKEVKTKVLNTALANLDAPDLVLKKISWDPAAPYTGDTVSFTVTVQNQGYAPAFDENNSVGMIINVDGELLGWGGVSEPIESGDTVELKLRSDWSSPASAWTAVLGEHQIEAWVNNQNLINEANFDNNNLTKTIVVKEPPTTDTLYFRTAGTVNVRTLSAGPGENAAGDLVETAVVYNAHNINGAYDAVSQSEWNLYLDSAEGSSVTLQISYDFTGDGSWDRVETSLPLAVDSAAGWELFTQNAGVTVSGSNYETFVNGKIKAELITAPGSGSVSLKVNDVQSTASGIKLPYPVMTVTPVADLVITDLTWSPAEPGVGEGITFSATISNFGEVSAKDGNGAVGCVFRVLDAQTGAQLAVTWGWITEAIGSGEASIVANLPGQGPALAMSSEGTFIVQAETDDQNNIVESDDTNNILEKEITIKSGQLPDVDLEVLDISWAPEAPVNGDDMVFTVTVRNNGTLPAANSDDAVGMIINIDGELLGWGGVSSPIAGGETVTMQLRADWSSPAVSWSAVTGSHTVEAFVDNQGTILETNTDNNRMTETFEVTDGVAEYPDLVIDGITYDQEELYEGDQVVFWVQVTNQGTKAAANADGAVGMIINVDGELLGWGGLNEAIQPGQSVSMQLRADWGSPAAEWIAVAGTHQIEAVVDNQGHITEENEDNNTSTISVLVNEGTPERADLVVDAIAYAPETVYEGDLVSFLVTVTNNGTAPAATAENTVGMIIKIDGEVLGWGGVSEPIAPGQTVTMELRADWGSPAVDWTAVEGSHTIEAVVDNMNDIVEEDDENNSLTAALEVTVRDTTAPTAKLVKPGRIIWVNVNSDIVIEFSEEMDADTINKGTVMLKRGRKNIKASYSLSDDGTTLTIDPNRRMKYGKWYRVIIKSNKVTDLAGNSLEGQRKWYFYTEWKMPKWWY